MSIKAKVPLDTYNGAQGAAKRPRYVDREGVEQIYASFDGSGKVVIWIDIEEGAPGIVGEIASDKESEILGRSEEPPTN
jgi:hypothetical protein